MEIGSNYWIIFLQPFFNLYLGKATVILIRPFTISVIIGNYMNDGLYIFLNYFIVCETYGTFIPPIKLRMIATFFKV